MTAKQGLKCAVDGCAEPSHAKGWCRAHYIRWRNHGDPLGGRFTHPRHGDCAVPGCDRKGVRLARGWCMAHYERWRKYGTPTGGGCLKGDAVKFFNEVVLSHDTDECLPWPYAKSTNGYGQITVDGQKWNVHRYTCTAVHGEPPTPRHEAAHSCGNGHLGCVNKRHLSWKTPEQNQADRVLHGTSNRGERQWCSKLTRDDVRRIRHLISKGWTDISISELFDVGPTAIYSIRTGKTWSWLDAPEQEDAA